MKKSDEFLLEQLIHFRSNDLLADIEYGYADAKTKHHITELIIGVTRYVNDVRYCRNIKCSCSPETEIKRHYEPIKEFLKGTRYALYPVPWKTIEEIIKED